MTNNNPTKTIINNFTLQLFENTTLILFPVTHIQPPTQNIFKDFILSYLCKISHYVKKT